MRWPWVSRAYHDEVVAAYRAAVEETRTPIRETFARFDTLLDRYHALKLQGAVSVPVQKPVEAKEPDAIQWAITERSNGNSALRFHLTKWAAREQRSGADSQSIIERINNWQSASDDE